MIEKEENNLKDYLFLYCNLIAEETENLKKLKWFSEIPGPGLEPWSGN